MSCSRCLGASYCCKECQQSDWTNHKTKCWKIDKSSYEDYLRLYFEAESFFREGNLVMAETLGKKALNVAQSLFHAEDTRQASVLIILGQVYQAQGLMNEAVSLFEKAYVLYSTAFGAVHVHVQEITFLLINALLQACDWDKAYYYAEVNYQTLIDLEGECTCYLVAETARQLGAIYKHFNMDEKEEIMYLKAVEHYSICPDLVTRARVDMNYAKYGGYLGLLARQMEDFRCRIKCRDGEASDVAGVKTTPLSRTNIMAEAV